MTATRYSSAPFGHPVGRRGQTPAPAEAMSPSPANAAVSRIWAAALILCALVLLVSGRWLTALFLMAHAALVLPECIERAHHGGWPRVRSGLAWGTLIAAVATGVTGTAMRSGAGAPPATRATPMTLGESRAKIERGAVFDTDRSFDPKLYAKLGSAKFRQANALNDWVALHAALSPRCDRVTLVEVSDEASRAELKWFADCADGERFDVSEAQARTAMARFQGHPDSTPIAPSTADLPVSQSAKLASFDEIAAVSRCDGAMKSLLQSSGSYRPAGSWTTTRHPARGRVTITRSFRARNAFNAELDSRWECLIDAADSSIIELKYLDGGKWRAVSR